MLRSLKAGITSLPDRATKCVTTAQSGYVLIEMLVSTAIASALLGVLLQFAVAAQGTVRAQADIADLQQRLRVAVETLRRDLLIAGAGPSRGPGRGPLNDVFAPIVPARTGVPGADPELSYYADRISIMYVTDPAPQTTLRAGMASAGAPLLIDGSAPGCRPAGACGFAAGDRVVIFEPIGSGGAHEVFTLAAADDGLQWLLGAGPLSRAYAAGSRVAGVEERGYYLDRPRKRLMMYDGDRSDVPLVDHVVDLRFAYYAAAAPASVLPPSDGESNCAYAAGPPPLPLLEDLGGAADKLLGAGRLTDGPICGIAPNRFDADLLRVRRVGVTIRVETESGELRGSMQVTFDVAPRNMGGR